MTINVEALQLLESDEATTAIADCGIFTFFGCPMFTSTEYTD